MNYAKLRSRDRVSVVTKRVGHKARDQLEQWICKQRTARRSLSGVTIRLKATTMT